MKLRVAQLAKCAGVAFIVIAAAAACSGKSALPLCPQPVEPAFAMTDPSPGATGVPDNLRNIAFVGFGPSRLTLSSGAQTSALALKPVPTQTSSPGGLPQFIAAVPTPLLAATTYTVSYIASISGPNCATPSFLVTVGSFKTR
ncbi:MAG TPA: hypothetical protein VGZ02_05440 [Candidatus Baltobacteraceae bacterium]|nr:hypothetical protein [Candidatus Baltobacteraceae bacterium]